MSSNDIKKALEESGLKFTTGAGEPQVPGEPGGIKPCILGCQVPCYSGCMNACSSVWCLTGCATDCIGPCALQCMLGCATHNIQ